MNNPNDNDPPISIPRLREELETFRSAVEVQSFASEQMNPLQEMAAAFIAVLAGRPLTGQALLGDYAFRLHAGENMGEMLDPLRSVVGRKDALSGKPCEAPDVGYLSGYCDGVIEKEIEEQP